MRAGRSFFVVALAAICAVVAGTVPLPTSIGVGEPSIAAAANDMTPWVLPSMPTKCTEAQKSSGNVGSCLLDGTAGLPEDRGWPAPPFPETSTTTTSADPAAWVNLQRGDTGTRVSVLQQALLAAGITVVVDGSFGSATETAVRTFQTNEGLTVTGVVDAATADALGILTTGAGGPFPPTGWTWLGWGYNRSPALADWETRLIGNAAKFGPVNTGQIRSMPEALPLFEGFLREIVAGGYKINEVGGYVFRCTSNSRKTCEGLTRRSLSNHSWGLAIDMNTAANPELTYRGVDGQTACATTMRSDIPRWVVQAAEKWGLYWGGYGWGGGCPTPSSAAPRCSATPCTSSSAALPRRRTRSCSTSAPASRSASRCARACRWPTTPARRALVASTPPSSPGPVGAPSSTPRHRRERRPRSSTSPSPGRRVPAT